MAARPSDLPAAAQLMSAAPFCIVQSRMLMNQATLRPCAPAGLTHHQMVMDYRMMVKNGAAAPGSGV
jgi:hypothetical protein